MSDTFVGGRVLKAASVQLRGTDPHSVPVEDRIAAAEERAFRAGYEQGYTAGALQAGATLADTGDRLRREVLAAVEAHSALVRENRSTDAEQLVELALAVAEWAVRRELATVPDAFFGRLAEVLADRERNARVEIVTSPALVARTREWLADETIGVTGADDLDDGEARVVIGDTTVFATFADAFERARAVLDALGADHHDPAAPGGAIAADEDDEDDDVEVEVLYDADQAGAR